LFKDKSAWRSFPWITKHCAFQTHQGRKRETGTISLANWGKKKKQNTVSSKNQKRDKDGTGMGWEGKRRVHWGYGFRRREEKGGAMGTRIPPVRNSCSGG